MTYVFVVSAVMTREISGASVDCLLMDTVRLVNTIGGPTLAPTLTAQSLPIVAAAESAIWTRICILKLSSPAW